MSVREFKGKFLEKLLSLHWKQWSALGVASHVEPERKKVVDIESLIVSTSMLEEEDKRLYGACLEWVIKHRDWVSETRLKRIGKILSAPFTVFDREIGLLNTLGLEAVENALGKRAEKTENFASKVAEIPGNYRTRSVVGEFNLKLPSLLQLRLRGIFGTGARAEIFLFLLLNSGGNSNSISKEIYYDQKLVYRTLEAWNRAGLVSKLERKREGFYTLRMKKLWKELLGIKELPSFINWPKTFRLLHKIWRVLSVREWEDEYLLSSFFREISAEAKEVLSQAGLELPEPSEFEAAAYFKPFLLKVFQLME